MSRVDLASLASHYASVKIGRKLTIQTLKLHLGSTLTLELRGVSFANMKGGSQPSMVELARLKAEIAPWSLISGPILIEHLSIDGADLLLERGADDRPNWKIGASHPHAAGRTVLPTILDAHFKNIAIDIRTSSGAVLRIHVDDASEMAAAAGKPISLTADGSYNGTPIHAVAKLPSFTALHGKVGLPTALTLSSSATTLAFEGTATDPLGFDGLDGRATLAAPDVRELLAIISVSRPIDLKLNLAGAFSHHGGSWRLTDGYGTLDGNPIRLAFQVEEGQQHQPDALSLDAAVKTLDVDALTRSDDPRSRSTGSVSLLADPAPGVLLDAHIAADHVAYRTIRADEFDLKGKIAPGLVSVEQIALKIAGGSARSRMSITNRDTVGVLDFDGSLSGVDAAGMAKLMGWGPLPVGGPIDSHVSGSMIGATLAQARATNRIFAIVTMNNGTIDRKLVRMASTDMRLMFGGQNGSERLGCLLAVMDLHDGIGAIAPIRIQTSGGTIVGGGSYDARHDLIDVAIGTRSSTTSIFALDLPVRISGPVSDFSVRPTSGATARRLATSGSLAGLPPDMGAFASDNPCAKP